MCRPYDLSKFNKKQLCEIWNALNGWEWPTLLGEKPEGWDDIPNTEAQRERLGLYAYRTKSDIIRPIQKVIEMLVPWRSILQYGNTHDQGKYHMSRIGFAIWWFKNKRLATSMRSEKIGFIVKRIPGGMKTPKGYMWLGQGFAMDVNIICRNWAFPFLLIWEGIKFEKQLLYASLNRKGIMHTPEACRATWRDLFKKGGKS